ncbi:hypothetical protein [Lysobacter capsici]|uniref:hypothetical protein n=1 Tax=Lysobacter capsici TaxID=435897 RepID=UPI001C00549B|nr:hypothetical protein [Lysobacter capsici]QWF15832.1 hypothetical protein KME82_18915 [Lysobacter capsici]
MHLSGLDSLSRYAPGPVRIGFRGLAIGRMRKATSAMRSGLDPAVPKPSPMAMDGQKKRTPAEAGVRS